VIETAKNSAGALDRLRDLSAWIFGPAKTALAPVNRWLDGLPPSVWHATAIGLFVVAGLCCLCLKRSYVYLGAPDQARWRDLRAWAVLALAPYAAIYYLLS
jgi:hypothetical protein